MTSNARTRPGRRARPVLAVMTVALMGIACPPASQTLVPDAPIPVEDVTMSNVSPSVETIAHPSGMSILYRPNHATPVAAFQVWVRVGSGDESPSEAGLAHVHEHMLFKGTERRAVGEIARDIEAMGGAINAWTSFDQTVYHIVVPSRFAAEGLDVLLDAVSNSAFDGEELERELEVIQEEIRRSEDMPSRAVSRLLFETVFRTHPYGRPVIGTHESVAAFERDDVLRFFQRWYRPTNMTLVAVGDVDLAVVDEAVGREFGREAHAAVDRIGRPDEPPQDGLRVAVEERTIQDGHLAVAFRAPELSHEDTPALELLAILMGQGESSILFESVQRRARLTNEVYAYLYSPAEPGIFMLGATYSPQDGSVDAHDVLGAITEQVAQLRHREIPASDIRRALTILESDAVYQRQTVQGVAQRMGYFHTVAGGTEFENRLTELARQVTPEQLRSVARRYLTPENMTVALVTPDSVEQQPTEASLGATVQAAFERVDTEVERFELEPDEVGAVRHEFDNGLVVVVQHDRTAPLFSVRAAVMGGLLSEGPEDNGVGNLIAHLLTSGTEARSASALALEVDSLAASLSGFSGRNTVGLRMTALSRDFETAMEVFADALLHSTFPDDEIERTRAEVLSDIAAQADNLGGSAFRMFNEAAYAGHPYERSVLGTAESVGGLDRSELLEAYHRLVQPSRMVVAVVGDVDPERALTAIAGLFEDTAPAAPRALADRPQPTRTGAPVRVGQHRDRQQSHVVLGYPTESMDGPLRYALDVLGAVLGGQGGRLFVELRDRQSLAYSVSAYSSCGLDAGTFAFYVATSPNKVDQALEAIRGEVERLRTDGITEEELARAQRYLIGRRDIGLQRQSARAGYYTFDALYGRGYDHGYAYASRVEAVTTEDVARAARQYFLAEQEIVAVVGPGAESETTDEAADE